MARFNEAATFAAKGRFRGRGVLPALGPQARLPGDPGAVRPLGPDGGAGHRQGGRGFRRDKTKCPAFKPHGAVTYDERILGFKGLDRVSLWTLTGRMVLPLVYGEYQGERFDRIKGQCDLVYRKGKFFLYATVDVPEGAPSSSTDFLGVDLGPREDRHRQRRQRPLRRGRRGDPHASTTCNASGSGKRNTKGAKKKLKRIAGKEARFRRHENHCISKAIVATAKDTARGIAVEDLTGIRDRLPVWGRDARNRLSGWSFAQLVAFLSYKAELAGVPLVKVDPRNTSRTCSACGHCEKDNRKSQEKFLCVSCGMGRTPTRTPPGTSGLWHF